ncbi:MAG: tetratricopeptide repeat protein, partial [Methylobacter sp.]
LVSAANQNTQAGNLESAVSSIERAIRIEPRNATLYYKLAVLRLKQSKPRLAEDLAKKSALLAAGDTTLKKHSWLLIAKTREIQKDFKGANEARAKAARF